MKYFNELQNAMSLVSEQSNVKIVGQTAIAKGTAMHNTLAHIPENKRLEFPVCEATQLNFSVGLSLNGFNVVSIFPRWNFLLVACSQLVNTLDKLQEISNNEFIPKVIIRTSIGSKYPLNPKKQHTGDFSEAFDMMLETVKVVRLDSADMIIPEYKRAIDRKNSTILVEFADLYNEK